MSGPSTGSSTIYVSGLDNQVTEQTLHDAFLPYGEILGISLPRPELKSSTDSHRGFGYVEFSLADDAREAIDNMDQAELFGRVIKVNHAKPKKEAHESLGSRTALWEQEGYAAKYNLAGAGSNDGDEIDDTKAADPMQGLEGLDEAGPRQ